MSPKNSPQFEQGASERQATGRLVTEAEAEARVDSVLPDAQAIRDILVKTMPHGGTYEKALVVVIERAIGQALANTACDYIADHLATALPAAIDRAIESEWNAHVADRRIRDTLQKAILRQLENAIQKDIAARYEIDVEVAFRKKVSR